MTVWKRLSMPREITRTFPEFFVQLKKLGFSPSTCIDVGAASGTDSIYKAFPNALHVAFEPLEDFQDQLKKILKPYRHEIHQCALMDTDGEKPILRQTANLYTSSLMHSRSSEDERLSSVAVKKLDDVMAEHDLAGGLLIKTDCQGADLFVLKGGLQTLKKADIVIVETSLFKFWGPNHPDFFEIIRFMRQRGFVVYDILDGIFRPHDKALGQVDLVFAKNKGPIRASSQW